MKRLLLFLLVLSLLLFFASVFAQPTSAQSQTIPVVFGGYAFDQQARHQIAADLWLLRTNTRYFVKALVPFVGVSTKGVTKAGLGVAMVGGDDVGGWVFVDARGYGYVGGFRGVGADVGFGVCLGRVLIRGAYGWATTDQPRRGGNASVAVLVRIHQF